jgi:tRNA (guanine10-N2)-methyltransferase
LLSQYSLKTRTVISTTSMAADYAFLMANMGQVGSGNLVLDPFVGTGSVLVSCAAFGAYTIGCDIDARVLRGLVKGSGGTMADNFRQYGMDERNVSMLVADVGHAPWRGESLFDAIVCDRTLKGGHGEMAG